MRNPTESSSILTRTRTGAELVVDGLVQAGVRVVAGMPGGAILPIYDALYESPVRHILARHEQGAAFIAHGMARATGIPAVCLATSGPGATNLLTALADAAADSIPLVAITGQVPTALIGTNAFQEVDILSMVHGVVRAAWQIRDAREIPAVLRRAFALARGGRPGPVLIDIPKDIQLASVPEPDQADAGPHAADPAVLPSISQEIINRMAQAIFASNRPVLYIGGGIIHADAAGALRRFAAEQNIPVVSSLMGLGAFDAYDENWFGMLGMHAARYTNLLLEETDCLIAVGVRFDDRAAGRAAEFCPRAKILHIDIDAREIGKLRAVDLALVADAGQALVRLAAATPARARRPWRERTRDLRACYPLDFDNRDGQAIRFLRELDACLEPEDTVTTDVGQHQMWAAQYLRFRRPRSLLTSGGLGTMGFGLPAAIGAALARPERRVFCITGDGSLLLNIQELATLREIDGNVKILLMNNNSLGLVRQQQNLFFERRLSACDPLTAPDFLALARAFGLPARLFPADDGGGVAEFLNEPGPALLEIPIGRGEMVFPMVPPGRSNREMLGAKQALV